VFGLSLSLQAMHQETPGQQPLGQPLIRPGLNPDSLSKAPNNGIPSMLGLLGSHQEPASTKAAAAPVQAIASEIGGGGTNTFRQTLEQKDANEGPAARSQQLLQQTNPLNQAQMLLKQQLQQAPQVEYHYAPLFYDFPCCELLVNAADMPPTTPPSSMVSLAVNSL
jgi:hypothetical protein